MTKPKAVIEILEWAERQIVRSQDIVNSLTKRLAKETKTLETQKRELDEIKKMLK